MTSADCNAPTGPQPDSEGGRTAENDRIPHPIQRRPNFHKKVNHPDFLRKTAAVAIDCWGCWTLMPVLHAILFEGAEANYVLFLIGISGLLGICLYKPLMEFLFGTTIGGLALKIGVIDGSGRMISLRAAFLRNLPVLLLTIPVTAAASWNILDLSSLSIMSTYYVLMLFFAAADIVVMLRDPRKRRLCDILAGTYSCVASDISLDFDRYFR